MRYIYDARGRKISQEVYKEGGLIAKKSDYAGEFFYENDTLRFMSHEEGRVVMADTVPEYQEDLKNITQGNLDDVQHLPRNHRTTGH